MSTSKFKPIIYDIYFKLISIIVLIFVIIFLSKVYTLYAIKSEIKNKTLQFSAGIYYVTLTVYLVA